MSKERYVIETSWKLPTGEALVVAVNKSEAMFFYTIQQLHELELINDLEFLTAEVTIIRDGYQDIA